MKLRKYLTALTVTTVLAISACAGTPEPPPFEKLGTMAELYEAAKAEGELLVYGPTENLYSAVYEDFSKEYPGIEITTADIFGQELDSRLEGEQVAGGFEADLVHIGVSDMERYLDREFLTSYRPLNTEGLNPEYLGPDDTWSVPSRHLYAPVFNTGNLPSADVPTRWAQLTDPKWKGEIAVSNPQISGAAPQTLSSALDQNAIDESWIDDFIDNVEPTIYPSVANALQAVVTGEQKISLVAGYGTYMRQVKQGAPLGFAVMKDGGYFSDVAYGILVGTRHPAAAQLLTSWMFTPAGQASIAKHIYEFGTMPGAPAPEGAEELGIETELVYPGAETYKSTLELLSDKF